MKRREKHHKNRVQLVSKLNRYDYNIKEKLLLKCADNFTIIRIKCNSIYTDGSIQLDF